MTLCFLPSLLQSTWISAYDFFPLDLEKKPKETICAPSLCESLQLGSNGRGFFSQIWQHMMPWLLQFQIILRWFHVLLPLSLRKYQIKHPCFLLFGSKKHLVVHHVRRSVLGFYNLALLGESLFRKPEIIYNHGSSCFKVHYDAVMFAVLFVPYRKLSCG
jgi:hypothetical protein